MLDIISQHSRFNFHSFNPTNACLDFMSKFLKVNSRQRVWSDVFRILQWQVQFIISHIILTLGAPEATAVCAPLLDNNNILTKCRLTKIIIMKTICKQKVWRFNVACVLVPQPSSSAQRERENYIKECFLVYIKLYKTYQSTKCKNNY